MPILNPIEYFAKRNNAPLAASYDELKNTYRVLKNQSTNIKLNDNQRNIYGVARFPQTLAALTKVFEELHTRCDIKPKNVLDLGSGPGTGLFALAQSFPLEFSYTGVEKQPQFIAMSKDAIEHCLPGFLPTFHCGEILDQDLTTKYDLTLLSYVLSETPRANLEKTIDWALARTDGAMVIVDAGTKTSFEQLNHAREILINRGAKIVAPCPHMRACPLSASGDFCHFPAHVMRTEQLKKAKSGSASFEDEKFSYLIAVTNDALIKNPAFNRIVKKPMKRQGHVILDMCQKDGSLARQVIGKRAENYREAKRLLWGDAT